MKPTLPIHTPLLAIVLALGTAGCSHTVFVHEPPAGGFRLDKPRVPLKATLAAPASQDAARVRQLLERSGYFASLVPAQSGRTGNAEIDIAYRGVQCGVSESPSDTFLGTWWMTAKFVVVSVPTLGMVPPGASSETDCQQVFAYQLRAPHRPAARSVQYPYKVMEYSTTAPGLYTSESKEKYQKDYLLDQAVAALLSDISKQLSRE